MTEAIIMAAGVAIGYLHSIKQIQAHQRGIETGYKIQTGMPLPDDTVHDTHSVIEHDEEYQEQKHFEELHENYYTKERWDD